MKVTHKTTGQEVMILNKTQHPLYSIWYDMIRRCYNPSRHNYKYYGGRGITVCDNWRTSFDAFVLDVGKRPKGYELDRTNNQLGYSPDNCKWVSHREQSLNRRPYGTTGFRNVYLSGEKFEASLRRLGKFIYLGTFKTAEEASSTVERYRANEV